MNTHHKQTALRYMQSEPDEEDMQRAMVHAQLETAAQIERLADTASLIYDVVVTTARAMTTAGDSVVDFLREAFPAILAMIGSGGLSFGVKGPFDPNDN